MATFTAPERALVAMADDPIDDILAAVPRDANPVDRENEAWRILKLWGVPTTLPMILAVGAYLVATNV